MRYIVNTPLVSQSNLENSLAGITDQANLDVGYVQSINRYYRWFAANTTAPDGRLIIIPEGQNPAVPGRWIAQGPPGPALVDPSKPANLSNAGSSGTLFYGLSNVIFVDIGTTTPLAQQDGRIGTPFGTLTQAADAARAIPGTFTIVAVPGDYSSEGPINLSANLVSWVNGVVPLGLESSVTRITVASIFQMGVGTSVPITLQDVNCGNVSATALNAYNCFIGNGSGVFGPMRLRNCATLGILSAQSFESVDSSHEDLTLLLDSPGTPIAELRSARIIGTPVVTFTGNPGRLIYDDLTAYWLQAADFSAPTNGTKELLLGAAQYIRMWVANIFDAGPPAQPAIIYNQTTPIVGGAIVRLDVPQANRQITRTNWWEIADSPQGPISFVAPATVAAPALVRVYYQFMFQLLATKDVTCWSGIQASVDPTPRGIQQHQVTGDAGDRFNMAGSVIIGAIEDATFWPCLRVIAGQQFAANELGVNDLFFSCEWMGTQVF